MTKSINQIRERFIDLKKQIDLAKLNSTKLHIAPSKYFPNRRNLAFTTEEKYPQIFISSKLKTCSWKQIDAILMHELSHVVLISKKQKHTEYKTDKYVEKLFNCKIYYDKNDIQTLKKTSKTKRPKHLLRY